MSKQEKVLLKPLTQGYFGCSCHCFESWEEYKRYQKQKLEVGDEVTHRCDGKKGIVSEASDGDGFCIVKFGTRGVASDHELEHTTNLIKTDLAVSSQH